MQIKNYKLKNRYYTLSYPTNVVLVRQAVLERAHLEDRIREGADFGTRKLVSVRAEIVLGPRLDDNIVNEMKIEILSWLGFILGSEW